MQKRFGVLCITFALLLIAAGGVSAESVNVIKNGSFEADFFDGVGEYWEAFNGEGPAAYNYYPDTWEAVIFDGEYSQLMEMHTEAVGDSAPDRYMGIYQVVDVVPDAEYMFSFYGMVRSTGGSEGGSQGNFDVQVGFDLNGGTDPDAVTEWTQMDWPEYGITDPGSMQSYAHGVTATGDEMTVFIRLWEKSPTPRAEVNVNIDAVSLVGPQSGEGAVSEEAPPEEGGGAEEADEEETRLPDTGGGSVLPLVGLLLAVVLMGITGTRLFLRLR